MDSKIVGAVVVMGGFAFLFGAVMGGRVILRARPGHAAGCAFIRTGHRGRARHAAVPAVLAFADQYRSLSYTRINRLAAWLNWGHSLPESLERSPKLVSRDSLLLTWAGQSAGTLPRAL